MIKVEDLSQMFSKKQKIWLDMPVSTDNMFALFVRLMIIRI